MTLTIHIPTADERAAALERLTRTNTEQLSAYADRENRNRTRELYGSTEGSVEITIHWRS